MIVCCSDRAEFTVQHIISLPEGVLFVNSLDWSPKGNLLCVGVGGEVIAALVYDVSGSKAQLVSTVWDPVAQLTHRGTRL